MPRKLALLWAASAAIAVSSELRVPVSIVQEPATTQADETDVSAPALAPSDFKARLTGIGAAAVGVVRSPNDDLLIITAIDLTGDIAYAGPAKSALSAAFESLSERTHITILHAQDGLRVARDPTVDRQALVESMMSLPVNGKSALLDTVQSAAQLGDAVAAKSNVRVAVLYVTDSDVRNYREDFTNPVINSSDSRDLSRRFPEGLIRERVSRVSASLAKFQTPIFIVHIRHTSERLNEAYQTGLLQLATVTGGNAQFCRSAAEIPDAIARTVQQLASQYRVHVKLPSKTPKSVTLSITSGDRVLNYRTRYALR